MIKENQEEINSLIRIYNRKDSLHLFKGMRKTLPVTSFPSLEMEATSCAMEWVTTSKMNGEYSIDCVLTINCGNHNELGLEYICELSRKIVQIFNYPQNMTWIIPNEYQGKDKTPVYCQYSDVSPTVMTYKESDIISMDISPYIENRYNTFLTLGLLVKNDTEAKQIVPDGCKPGMKFSGVKTRTDDYPWSRIITNRESGLVTIKDLEKFHKTNVKFGSSDVFQGTVVVPGFHGFFIFDKIKITCDNGSDLEFYITGINHNINLQSKDWTTSLSVASFEVGNP